MDEEADISRGSSSARVEPAEIAGTPLGIVNGHAKSSPRVVATGTAASPASTRPEGIYG